MTDITRVSSSLYWEGLTPDLFGSLWWQQIDKVADDTISQVSLLRWSSNGDDYVKHQIVNELRARGVTNYYDFYFLSLSDFKDIIRTKSEFLDLFRKSIGIHLSKSSTGDKERFWEFLWFEKIRFEQCKIYILRLLQSHWISSIDELRVFWFRRFKETFWDDNVFNYFFVKIVKTTLLNSSLDKILSVWVKLWLPVLSWGELKSKLTDLLSGIEQSIPVRKFMQTFWKNILVRVYFSSLGKYDHLSWKYNCRISRADLDWLFEYLWFNKDIEAVNERAHVKEFFRSHWCDDYQDLRAITLKSIRPFIWEDEVCRRVLIRFWLNLSKNFNLDYLQRLARFAWLSWVPEVNDKVIDVKTLLIRFLSSHWVHCLYWLRLLWVKLFERSVKDLPQTTYETFNAYIKTQTWKTITHMNLDDFIKVWSSIWLIELNENEHKLRFLRFLESNWIKLSSINVSFIKGFSNLWENPNLRYIFEFRYWVKNLRDIRSSHVSSFISYLSN